ncbi:MAG: hypothetical protein K1W02_11300, partial [Muribaculaceae bacterium]
LLKEACVAWNQKIMQGVFEISRKFFNFVLSNPQKRPESNSRQSFLRLLNSSISGELTFF